MLEEPVENGVCRLYSRVLSSGVGIAADNLCPSNATASIPISQPVTEGDTRPEVWGSTPCLHVLKAFILFKNAFQNEIAAVKVQSYCK